MFIIFFHFLFFSTVKKCAEFVEKKLDQKKKKEGEISTHWNILGFVCHYNEHAGDWKDEKMVVFFQLTIFPPLSLHCVLPWSFTMLIQFV